MPGRPLPSRPRPRGPVLVLLILLLSVGILAVAYAAYHRSDAYRRGNRLFYRAGRPNRAGRLFGDLWAAVGSLGLGPSYLTTLETIGHHSGRWHGVPLVLVDHGGEQYVVSMLGERSPWVHNVRAADGRAAIRHGRRRWIRLVEVPPEDRAPILRAYLGRALGARPHIPVDPGAPLEAFQRIASDYPVFRIEHPSDAA